MGKSARQDSHSGRPQHQESPDSREEGEKGKHSRIFPILIRRATPSPTPRDLLVQPIDTLIFAEIPRAGGDVPDGKVEADVFAAVAAGALDDAGAVVALQFFADVVEVGGGAAAVGGAAPGCAAVEAVG